MKYVPGWFVMHQKLLRVTKRTIGRRCMFPHYDDDLIKWYEGYNKQKAQKTSIKEELMPIAWHLSRWWDWCVSNDEKHKTKKLFLTT